jgi:excisionase family DNA binding protein
MSVQQPAAPRVAYLFEEGMCEQLGLGKTTAYRELKEGRIETYLVGRRRYVTHQALLDFVERMKARPGFPGR